VLARDGTLAHVSDAQGRARLSSIHVALVLATTVLACGSTVVLPADAGGPGSDADITDATTSDDAASDAASDASEACDGGDASDASDGGGLLRFAVFGDVRPPNFDDTANYPTMVVDAVMDAIQAQGAQFAVGTGDYMFAYDNSASAANAQLDLLLAAERRFSGRVYHAMGNHECTTASTSNCPTGNESTLVQAFHTRLIPDRAAPYYDWTTPTPLGDAHFVVTAPNAWSDAQAAWLTTALAASGVRYTFVIAHEPPTSTTVPPGTAPIEMAMNASASPVTLRLYGHVHYYRHMGTNVIVVGNGGAPLSGTSAGAVFGFTIVEQRADGDVVITAYELGSPPTVLESFVLHPDGTASH
jgi:hypothetical protein